MLFRLSLNFAAHLVAGVAFGALAASAAHALRTRDDESGTSAQSPTAGPAPNNAENNR
ncbi:MAG: hypothetical protein QNJ30_20295 [Kiloniellales bacterium]|nr:hypothetical protein [Kiloniellales bacterium]